MNTPFFIQLSTLTTFPASLLNRDDSGLAKRMPFGPCTRTRVSSQCLKRHWRLAEDAHALQNAAEELELSVRSRHTFVELVEKPLIAQGYDKAAVKKASGEVQKLLFGGKSGGADEQEGEQEGKKKAKGGDAEADTSRSELVVLGRPEIQFLKERIEALVSSPVPDMKKWWKVEKEAFTALKYGAGIDAALFGRFVAGEAAARISSAVHVAHAFTVHAAASETDYFTAVDDLQDVGSAHINAAELTSGIFYSYVVIDVPLLVSNLTGKPARQWNQPDVDREVAAAVVGNFLHLFTKVSPGAKLGSTAPYAHAWLALAEVGAQQPRSLADAFLKPVPLRGDMRQAAAEALGGFVSGYDAMYGQGPQRYLACTPDIDPRLAGAERLSVPDMAAALARRVREGV